VEAVSDSAARLDLFAVYPPAIHTPSKTTSYKLNFKGFVVFVAMYNSPNIVQQF